MRKQNKLIMGIGHRVKTIENTDKRVQILKEFALKVRKFSENSNKPT